MMKKFVWVIGLFVLSLTVMLFAQNRVAVESAPALIEEIFTPLAAEVTESAPADQSAEVVPSNSLQEDTEVMDDEFILGGAEPELATQNSGLISFSFEDRPISEVITDFSLLSGANIITPDLGEEILSKKTSITLNFDISDWKSSMQAVLSSQGLELYEEVPGSEIYLIRQKVAGALPPLEMEVFKLNFASVDTVEELLLKIISPAGTLSTFPERNLIVVRGTAKSLQDVRDVLVLVDLPREQVFIEAKFLELRASSQRDLGINWGVLENYSIGASGMNSSYNRSKTDTDSDSTTRSISFDDTTSFIDAQDRFYDIAGRTYEEGSGVTDEPARNLNTDPDHRRLSGLTPTRTLTDLLSDSTSDSLADVVSGTMTETVTKQMTALLSADDFALVMSALDQNGDESVVSNPKIIVANEEEAVIQIGEMEPNIRLERTAGTTDNPGGSTTAGLDGEVPWFEDGIKLTVKPTIHTDENITVKIEPEITRFGERKVIRTADIELEYPHMFTKKINTIFSMESGQTAAIGGLTESKENEVKTQVPFLGSLPLIGRIFSYEHMKDVQVETIIFVTVGLANPVDIEKTSSLPARAPLSRKYNVREEAEVRLEREKLRLYQKKKTEELEAELTRLRKADEVLMKKAEEKAAKDAEAEEQKALRAEEQKNREEQTRKELDKAKKERDLAQSELAKQLESLRKESEKREAKQAALIAKEQKAEEKAREAAKKAAKKSREDAERAEKKARKTAEKAEAKARKERAKQSEKEAKERAKNVETLRRQQDKKEDADVDVEEIFKSLSI